MTALCVSLWMGGQVSHNERQRGLGQNKWFWQLSNWPDFNCACFKHKCQITKLRVKRGRDGVETVSPTGGNNKQIIIKVTHGRSDPIIVIHVVGVSRYPCNFHVFQRLGDTFGAAQKLKQDQEVKTHQQEMRVLFANTLILKWTPIHTPSIQIAFEATMGAKKRLGVTTIKSVFKGPIGYTLVFVSTSKITQNGGKDRKF